MARIGAFIEAAQKADVLLVSDVLHPSSKGKRVASRMGNSP
jgi:hypothetical protein